MRWNNGLERRQFEKEQQKQAECYRMAGMTEEQIAEMYQFDLGVLRSDRNYYAHTVPLLPEGEEEDRSAYYKHNKEALSYEDSFVCTDELGWIDEIEDESLLKCIKVLTPKEQELLRLIAVDGYTQREIANQIFHVTEACISKRIRVIRKKMMEDMKNV